VGNVDVVAIPVYNEAGTVMSVVEQARQYVNEVLVVDDGSSDTSPMLANAAGAVVVRHESNQGKGAALATALAWARDRQDVKHLVLLDGDGQHDPVEIPRMLNELEDRQLDILIGSRFLGHNNAPLYRLFGLHTLSAAAALGSGIRITDSQSGYRVLSRRAIESLDLHEKAFSVEAEMQFDAPMKGLRIGETPIEIRYAGPARRSPIIHGVSVLIQTIKMTALRRPDRLAMLVATPFLAIQIGRSCRRRRAQRWQAPVCRRRFAP
jgi:glycosyltransferase involved in cell wall biosynthesis